MSERRPGIVTRSKSAFCHGDCKSPLIEEISDLKRHSDSSMSDTEASPDMDETVQKLERLLRRQNEYFDLKISGLFASMDKAPVQAAKAVKLEPFSGYESQDIERWLQKFANRIQAGGRQLDSSTMAADLASHLSGPAETYYFSLEPHMRRDFEALTDALKNRFSSDDFKWRLRQSLSSRKQGPKESLDSYIEFINSTCQRLGVSKADQLHFFVDGLREEIKREVLMHKPEDYQTAENLARLKVSVDRTIAEDRKDPEKDTEKAILYKLLDKLTPHPAVTAGSGVEKKVAAFNIADRSVNDLSGEIRKLRAQLRQELRDEIRTLRDSLTRPQGSQGSQFSRPYTQSSRSDFHPRGQAPARDVRTFGARPPPPPYERWSD